MNEGINLLDPNKNTGPAEMFRRLQKMRLLAVGLLFIISVASVILFTLVAFSPLPTLQKQEQFLRQTLTSSKDDIVKLAIVKGQTDAINTLINQRHTLDKPIGLVKDKISKDMTVTEIQADDKSLLLTVESTSLQSLDTFLNGLTSYVQDKNTFAKVILVDLSNDAATNAYSVTVQMYYL